MGLVAALVTVALAAAPAGAEAVDPALQLQIDRAIHAGTRWLLADRAAPGNPSAELQAYPHGAACLSLYTLLVSGAPRDHDVVQALVGEARRATIEVSHTYTLALALMGLATHDRRAHGATIAGLVARLEAGQITQGDDDAIGAWGYLLPRARTGDDATAGRAHPAAHWDMPDGWWDDSNTQYAVLALRTAADFGFQVDREVFRRAALHFVRRQGRDGGFSYSDSHRPKSYLSMTAGATGSLVMCADMLRDESDPDGDEEEGDAAGDDEDARGGGGTWSARERRVLRRQIDRAIERGTAWMSRELRFPAVDAPWPFYAAYSVERMGHYAQTATFGRKAWYAEGASWLVGIQAPDGSWSSTRLHPPDRGRRREGRADFSVVDYGSTVDTCFALLFLKRSSYVHTLLSDEITVLLRNLDPQASAAELERIRDRILSSGTAGIPQLVKALYLPTRVARDLAADCLHALTGEDMGLRDAADADELRRAREAWVRWLLEHPEHRG